jgi:hypothetical protein
MMKILFWIGLIVLVLGLASLFVPIPQRETEGFKAGPLSVNVQTQHDEKVSPIISAVMILAGAGLLVAGKVKA